MEITLTEALGSKWSMFYNPKVKIDDVAPVQTLKKSTEFVNQSLTHYGRIFTNWPAGAQDEVARLMWVNWIYQRLPVEPIRKPILCHLDQNQLVVDCGDTRLMALSLFDQHAHIGVAVTCTNAQAKYFDSWQPIYKENDLIVATGFSPDACVLVRSNLEHCLEWLEIGDQTTSHHLHDVDLRVEMMQNYINAQTNDFVFSDIWAKLNINWNNFKTKC